MYTSVELVRLRVAKRECGGCPAKGYVSTTKVLARGESIYLFRRKQKNAISIAPQTTTIMGVDQSMFRHILMRMSNAGVIGSLRFTGVRQSRLSPIMHRWTMNLSDGGIHT
jgi:hypothetical protein